VVIHAAAEREPDSVPEPGPADADLIERSWDRPERFADVFDRYYRAIHGYVSRRLGPALADDLASETFLIAFDRRRAYDLAYPDARPWLYGIASNLVSRQRRAEQRRYRALARADASGVVESHAERVVGRVAAGAERARLAAALLEIAPADREVLLLVAWGELSLEEAARALGVPAGTARSRLHRARQKTRAALAATASSSSTEDHTP
jgi:RNA polymerase sigma factor (sigma-70 family)